MHMRLFSTDMSQDSVSVVGFWLGEAILIKYAPWYIGHFPSAFPFLYAGRKKRRKEKTLLHHGGMPSPPETSPKRLEANQWGIDRVFSERMLVDTNGSVGRPANGQYLLGAGTGDRESALTQGDRDLLAS